MVGSQGFYCTAHTAWCHSRNSRETRRKNAFTPEEDIHNGKNSQVMVHVEIAICRAKMVRILKGNLSLNFVCPTNFQILWKGCCWLTAFYLLL